MSYTLTAYSVDLDELRRAVGGGDVSLVQAVVDYHPEAFGEAAADEEGAGGEADSGEEDGEEISLRRALAELVGGRLTAVRGSAHQYGYALRELCDYLGDDLGAWEAIRWSVLRDTGVDRVLEQSGPPVPLPANPGDFPVVGHIPRSALEARREEMRARRARGGRARGLAGLFGRRSRDEDADLAELYAEYEDWLQAAGAAGRDLVFFYS